MNVVEAAVLGVVQGLTEFIPVSSSGHLVLAERLFGMGADHLFIEFVNIGTVLALILYFRAHIWRLLIDVCVHHNWRLARNILISVLPAGIIGFLAADFIEKSPLFLSPWVVATMLFLVGVVMVVFERLPKLSYVKQGEDLNAQRAAGIGFAQVLALIPGVSRSGSTILAGRFAGLTAAAAAEYSFLLSIPIMLGVIAKLCIKASDRAYFLAHWQPIVVGNVFAFVAGLAAVGFLLRYLAKHNLVAFGWYRIILSLVVVTLLLLQ